MDMPSKERIVDEALAAWARLTADPTPPVDADALRDLLAVISLLGATLVELTDDAWRRGRASNAA
jgi:hypothetical protein